MTRSAALHGPISRWRRTAGAERRRVATLALFIAPLLAIGVGCYYYIHRSLALELELERAVSANSTQRLLDEIGRSLVERIARAFDRLSEANDVTSLEVLLTSLPGIDRWALLDSSGAFASPPELVTSTAQALILNGLPGVSNESQLQSVIRALEIAREHEVRRDRRGSLEACFAAYEELLEPPALGIAVEAHWEFARRVRDKLIVARGAGFERHADELRLQQLDDRARAIRALRQWGAEARARLFTNATTLDEVFAGDRVRLVAVGDPLTALYAVRARLPVTSARQPAIALTLEADFLAAAAHALLPVGVTLSANRPAVDEISSALPSSRGTLRLVSPAPIIMAEKSVAIAQRGRRLYLVATVALGAALGATTLAFVLMRRQAELARLRSELVANLSHELRTPIAVLRICAETLAAARARDPARAEHYAQVIERESERLERLVARAFSLARLDAAAGSGAAAKDVLDLRAITQAAAERFEPVFERAGIAAQYELSAAEVPVHGDCEELGLLLDHLFDNAVKHATGGRAIAVRVSVARGRAVLEVEDDGPGVARADRARIFERFYRRAQVATPRANGLGIGLAIARAVTLRHGGRLTCEAPRGVLQGARFVARLPLAARNGHQP